MVRDPLTKDPKRGITKEDRVFKVTVHIPHIFFCAAVDEDHATKIAIRYFIDTSTNLSIQGVEEWSEDTVDADQIFRDEMIAGATIH